MEQDGLVMVGEYRRDLAASLARMFENALDWEHLPHVHAGSFSSIELTRQNASGFRANMVLAGSAVPMELDLLIDRAIGRWVSTTRIGARVVSRIVTDAVATGDRSCTIHARFEVADIADDQREAVGNYYRRLYARLYDEDEAMMIARQHSIDAPDPGFRDAGGYTIPNACPHLGLPLDAVPDEHGIVTCPWHGYRFDAATGKCVSGAPCGWLLQPIT